MINVVILPLLTHNMHFPQYMGPLLHWGYLPQGWETLIYGKQELHSLHCGPLRTLLAYISFLLPVRVM